MAGPTNDSTSKRYYLKGVTTCIIGPVNGSEVLSSKRAMKMFLQSAGSCPEAELIGSLNHTGDEPVDLWRGLLCSSQPPAENAFKGILHVPRRLDHNVVKLGSRCVFSSSGDFTQSD